MRDAGPDRDIDAWSAAVLAKHARTFNLAGRLLPAESRRDAAILYAFCRHVDDLADEASDERAAAEALTALEAELTQHSTPSPLTWGFLELARRRSIPVSAALELIAGVRGDLGEVVVGNDAELLRYCYRVAGTVGLMMCGVIGVTDVGAIPHAIDLGIGMQLTNISRDVAEDAAMGRVYLPRARLEAAGTEPDALLNGAAPADAIGRVVGDLLALAEGYYDSAAAGFSFIPLKTRAGIMAAAWMYRAIGRRISARGCGSVLQGRTVVAPSTKARWLTTALIKSVSAGHRQPRGHCASLHSPLSGLPGANVP